MQWNMWDLSSLTRDQICPPNVRWKCRVLTSGPPEESLEVCLCSDWNVKIGWAVGSCLSCVLGGIKC